MSLLEKSSLSALLQQKSDLFSTKQLVWNELFSPHEGKNTSDEGFPSSPVLWLAHNAGRGIKRSCDGFCVPFIWGKVKVTAVFLTFIAMPNKRSCDQEDYTLKHGGSLSYTILICDSYGAAAVAFRCRDHCGYTTLLKITPVSLISDVRSVVEPQFEHVCWFYIHAAHIHWKLHFRTAFTAKQNKTKAFVHRAMLHGVCKPTS